MNKYMVWCPEAQNREEGREVIAFSPETAAEKWVLQVLAEEPIDCTELMVVGQGRSWVVSVFVEYEPTVTAQSCEEVLV